MCVFPSVSLPILELPLLTSSSSPTDRLLRPSLETATHPAFPRSQYFTTFPDPSLSSVGPAGEGTHYTFASSSCLKPGFPWAGPHKKSETVGARHFLKIAERLGVKFMVFLGGTCGLRLLLVVLLN